MKPHPRSAGAESVSLDQTFEALLLEMKPSAPPSGLKARVLDGVALETAAADMENGAIVTVPASEEGWVDLIPKVRGKRVYSDGTAESWLVRLAPGAHAPAHWHPGSEECLVLEGSIRYIEGSTLYAGDYEVVQPGARHSELVSDTGALVFLRYSQPLAHYVPY